MKDDKCTNALAIVLLVCMVVSGCTVNRVRVLSRQSAKTPVRAEDVRLFSSAQEISEPWRLEGMIAAYTMPIMSNTVEKRVALIKEEAASRGIDAVIDLQHPSGSAVMHIGRSVGVLAKTGAAQNQNADPLPKFIVCLPPFSSSVGKDLSTNGLDEYLLEYAKYYLGYYKGYYVYRCNTPGISKAGILQNGVSPGALIGPISIAPDFILMADVKWDETGSLYMGGKDYSFLVPTLSLKITMTLIDLKERKAVWENHAWIPEDWMGAKSLQVIHNFTSDDYARDELARTTNRMLGTAMNSVPVVSGFEGADLPMREP
jgi:hypothetical protein